MTVGKSSSVLGATAANERPQPLQKRTPDRNAAPHVGHLGTTMVVDSGAGGVTGTAFATGGFATPICVDVTGGTVTEELTFSAVLSAKRRPQLAQNNVPGRMSVPHPGQNRRVTTVGAGSRAPQDLQNAAVAAFGVPQETQFTTAVPASALKTSRLTAMT